MTCSIMGYYEWRCSIINQKSNQDTDCILSFTICYLDTHQEYVFIPFCIFYGRSCYSDCSFYYVLFHLTPFVSFCCLACAEVSTKTRVSFKCQFVTISPTIRFDHCFRNFYLSFDLKDTKIDWYILNILGLYFCGYYSTSSLNRNRCLDEGEDKNKGKCSLNLSA